MKNIKIYGESYQVIDDPSIIPDQYWYKKELQDMPLNKPLYGYVEMSDGTKVGVYKSTPVLPIIIIAVALILVAGGSYFLITKALHKVTPIEGTMLATKAIDGNNVIFNGVPQCKDGILDLRFTNGDKPAIISLSGNGINMSARSIEPNQTIVTWPVEVTTDKDVVEADLNVEVNGKSSTFPILIEIPTNNNYIAGGSSGIGVGDDTLGLTPSDHPFAGEEIIANE